MRLAVWIGARFYAKGEYRFRGGCSAQIGLRGIAISAIWEVSECVQV